MKCKHYVETKDGYFCKYWEEDNASCDDCNWYECE